MRNNLSMTSESYHVADGGGRVTSPSLVPLTGVAFYLIMCIFYVFPSGNPQPADVVLMATAMVTVLCVWHRYPSQPLLYFAAASFIFWVLLINSIWFLQIGDHLFMHRVMFYAYNMMVFFFVIALSYHDFVRLKTVVYWSLIVAVALQIVMLEVMPPPPELTRSVGTFNNPNQLGYWGLLTLVCFGVIKERQPLSMIDVGFLASAGYVVIRSLSKAASISAGLLILMIILFCGWRRGAGLLFGVLLITGATAEIGSGGYFGIIDSLRQADAVAKLEHRLGAIGDQKDDDIVTRGYYRIFDNPELMIFGAGEGDFARLDRHGDQKEFHSTLGNLLVSYGIVGISIFLLFLLLVFHRAPLPSIAYFIPLMTYGVTHNGIRSSLLWFFLALVYAQSLYGSARGSFFRRLLGPREAGRSPRSPQSSTANSRRTLLH